MTGAFVPVPVVAIPDALNKSRSIPILMLALHDSRAMNVANHAILIFSQYNAQLKLLAWELPAKTTFSEIIQNASVTS